MGREAETVRLGIGFALLPLLLLGRPACGADGGRRLQPRVEVQGHRGQVAARRAWAGGEIGADAELPSLPAGLLLLLLQPGPFLRAGQVRLRLHPRQQVAVRERGDLGRLQVHDPVRAEVRIAPVELEHLAQQGLQPFELPRGAGAGRASAGDRVGKAGSVMGRSWEGRAGRKGTERLTGAGSRLAVSGSSDTGSGGSGRGGPSAAPGQESARSGAPRRNEVRGRSARSARSAGGRPGPPRNRRVSNMDRRAPPRTGPLVGEASAGCRFGRGLASRPVGGAPGPHLVQVE